jgi:hypothetical protein
MAFLAYTGFGENTFLPDFSNDPLYYTTSSSKMAKRFGTCCIKKKKRS